MYRPQPGDQAGSGRSRRGPARPALADGLRAGPRPRRPVAASPVGDHRRMGRGAGGVRSGAGDPVPTEETVTEGEGRQAVTRRLVAASCSSRRSRKRCAPDRARDALLFDLPLGDLSRRARGHGAFPPARGSRRRRGPPRPAAAREAELRFGVSDPRGLQQDARVTVDAAAGAAAGQGVASSGNSGSTACSPGTASRSTCLELRLARQPRHRAGPARRRDALGSHFALAASELRRQLPARRARGRRRGLLRDLRDHQSRARPGDGTTADPGPPNTAAGRRMRPTPRCRPRRPAGAAAMAPRSR